MPALKEVKAEWQKLPNLWKCGCQRKTVFFILIYRNSRAFDGGVGERGKDNVGINNGIIRTPREDSRESKQTCAIRFPFVFMVFWERKIIKKGY